MASLVSSIQTEGVDARWYMLQFRLHASTYYVPKFAFVPYAITHCILTARVPSIRIAMLDYMQMPILVHYEL